MANAALDGTAAALETPSGKGARDENFPVGSWLLPAALRPHVAAFYAFVRAADDIADNPDLAPADKIARLDALRRGADRPARAAAALPKAAGAAREPRRDRRQPAPRARTCSPRSRGTRPSCATATGRICSATARSRRRRSAAICSICTARRSELYASPIPCAMRSRCSTTCRTARTTTGRSTGSTCRSTASPPPASGSRSWTGRRPRPRCARCWIACSTASTSCSRAAGDLPRALRSRRLAAESAVILAIARRLARELRRRDPLAERVELEPARFLLCGLTGIGQAIGPRPRRSAPRARAR